MIVNEPGLTPQIIESLHPDVVFYWGLHSKNLCIITNMNNWKCVYNSPEFDIIILQCKALKDTCFLTGTYFNPSLTREEHRKHTQEMHGKLYNFKNCRILIGGDMNCKSPMWHAWDTDPKGQIILDAFSHMNLCPAFEPTDYNCRYNKVTGEKTWIDSICIDVKLHQLKRAYKFTHLEDSDHDLHTVVFDIHHSSKQIISKQKLIKCFKKEDWNFLVSPWMGALEAEDRIYKLECILKNAVESSKIVVYPHKTRSSIPSCLLKRRRFLEKSFRKVRKRNALTDIQRISELIRDNQNLTKNFKKLVKKQRTRILEKEKGVWYFIKKFLGPNIFKRITSVDLLSKNETIDRSSIDATFIQDEPIDEPIPDIPDASVIPFNWNGMYRDVKKMMNKKKAVYNGYLSCYMVSILMEIIGDKLINFISICLTKGFTPRNIKRSRICLIPKSCGTKYRPLSIMHPIYRIFDYMIFEYIKKRVHINMQLYHQHGFLPDVGFTDYIVSIAKHLNSLHGDTQTCIITIDLKDAFENISIDGIIYGLHKANLDMHDIMLVVQHISNRSSFLEIDGQIKWKAHKKGTPQGSFLSPMIFALATVFLTNMSENTFRIFSFADDICIIATADGLRHDKWVLCETKLLLLEDMLRLFGLHMNRDKTKIMMLKNKIRSISKRDFKIGNEVITCVNTIKILGIKFNNVLGKFPKAKININDVLQESLLDFERIIKSNSTGFRGLKLKWAYIALMTFIRGRTEYYGIPLRLFMRQDKYKQVMVTNQQIIGRIFKSALDLKRSTSHDLLYFLTFKHSLEDIIEQRLFDHLLKFKPRNTQSWYPEFEKIDVANYVISGVPLPIWDESTQRASYSRQSILPDISIHKIDLKKSSHITITQLQTNITRSFKYLAIVRCGTLEISDALFLFIRDEIQIEKGQSIIIGCDELMANFLEKPECRTQLNCLIDNMQLKVIIVILSRWLGNKLNLPETNETPTRIVFNSPNYHAYVNYKTHESLRASSNNIMARGLHTYAFEQIEWKDMQRKDLFYISLLSGTWHDTNNPNDKCPLCEKQFHTLEIFINPCEHLRGLIKTQFTEENIYKYFSSIYKIRSLAQILLSCIKFNKNKLS